MSETLLFSKESLGPFPRLNFNQEFQTTVVYPTEVVVSITTMDPAVGTENNIKLSPQLTTYNTVSIQNDQFDVNYEPQLNDFKLINVSRTANIEMGYSDVQVVTNLFPLNRFPVEPVKPPLTLTNVTSYQPGTETVSIQNSVPIYGFNDYFIYTPGLRTVNTTETLAEYELQIDSASYNFLTKTQGIGDSQQVDIQDSTLPIVADIKLISIVDTAVGTDSPPNQIQYYYAPAYTNTEDQIDPNYTQPARQFFAQTLNTESQIRAPKVVYTTDTQFVIVSTPADPINDSVLTDQDLMDMLFIKRTPFIKTFIQCTDPSNFLNTAELEQLIPLQYPLYQVRVPGFYENRITINTPLEDRCPTQITLNDIKVVSISQTQTSISVGFNVQQIWY